MWPGGVNAPLETVMFSVMCQLGWDNESRYLVKPHSVCVCVCVRVCVCVWCVVVSG